MRYDYDWLMLCMGNLMKQYTRGYVVKSEFDMEMWLILRLHRSASE